MQWSVAGFCLKTKTESGDKVFINVCQGANVSDRKSWSVKYQKSVTQHLLKIPSLLHKFCSEKH